MIERFYNYDELQDKANCLDIALGLGMNPVKGQKDKFNIPWRAGSDSGALSINKSGWHDFVSKEKGGTLELVRRVKFNGDPNNKNDQMQEAQQWLGDQLGLQAGMTLQKDRKTRSDYLKESGYKMVKSYAYKDKKGELRHSVERWEHPEKKKEFIQRAADGRESVKGIELVLYRWNEWANCLNIGICEGEKDVDTLFECDMPSTTNCSGAGNWLDTYTKAVAGKNLIIFTDNDVAGKNRENFLLWELKDKALQMKAIRFENEEKGFDVTDYKNKYGKDKLLEYIAQAPVIDKKNIRQPKEDYQKILDAKQANKFDFNNYIEYKKEDKNVIKPRQIGDMIEETSTRFLGFPRRVGSSLFDHDRDTGEIELLEKTDDLFAWIARKSKRLINWRNGPGLTPKREFFSALNQSVQRYEEISYTPVWPDRQDAYPAYPQLPKPDPECLHLHGLLEFFNPASDEDRVLMYTLFAAPLYYESGISRPCWILDSEGAENNPGGAGAGKTTLAELVAVLYGSAPIKTNVYELQNKWDVVTKRMVSASGRQKRIFLLDNVTGTFHSPQFADLVTSGAISGIAPYGHGEETRPNNLTYILTANSATIDNDTAIRAYYIMLQRAPYISGWKEKVIQYIKEHRYEIISEILDKITKHKAFDMPAQTRFPEFETKILQPFCHDEDQYNHVLRLINEKRDSANVERDIGSRVENAIELQLVSNKLDPKESYFILSEVLEHWIEKSIPPEIKGHRLGYLRTLAKAGFTERLDGKTERVSGCSRRGFLWNKQMQSNRLLGVNVIGYVRPNTVGIL